MAHRTSLIVEDYTGDIVSLEGYDKTVEDMPEPKMVKLKTEGNSVVMLSPDDALALAGWLADWVEVATRDEMGPAL